MSIFAIVALTAVITLTLGLMLWVVVWFVSAPRKQRERRNLPP